MSRTYKVRDQNHAMYACGRVKKPVGVDLEDANCRHSRKYDERGKMRTHYC